jgi:hypothetical protein
MSVGSKVLGYYGFWAGCMTVFSNVPGFNDPVLVPLTHEDVRIITTYACPDEEFLAALKNARQTETGLLVGCRRECIIDVNSVLVAVSEESHKDDELKAIIQTCDKLEPYEFG